jgi:4-hydroxy-4-methyl-2-oxoglutarate aldolase
MVTCAALVDAMAGRHAHRCHVDGLVSPAPGKVAFGPAATMRCLPGRADVRDPERHDFVPLFREAVGADPAGKVLVIAAEGYPGESVAGGKKLTRLETAGCSGLVTDGSLRDFAGLAEMSFSAWCSGETVRWAGDNLMPYEAGVPVELRGVTVLPGDWIYADASGVAVIPAGDVAAVLEEAVRIEERDAQVIARIREDAARGDG